MPNNRLKRIKEQMSSKESPNEDRKALMSAIGEDIIDVLHPLMSDIAENSKMNKEDFKDIMSEFKLGTLKVQAPDIKIPAPNVDVTVPEVKLPVINVPTPKVNVTVPEIKIPTINVPTPTVTLPDGMSVTLGGVDKLQPLPVMMMDEKGRPQSFSQGAGGGKSNFLTISDIRGSSASIIDQTEGALKVTGSFAASLSADTGSGEIGSETLRMVQATDAVSSVQVKEIFGSVATSVLNADNRIRCSLETGGSGLTDAEIRATSLPVSQASGSIWSTEVKSGTITAVTDITNSVATYNLDAEGNYRDTMPIEGTLTGITNDVSIDDGGNSITVDGTVTATPSGTQDVDVTANSIGLATSAKQLADDHNVTVSSVTASVATVLTDSTGVQYSGSNRIPVINRPVQVRGSLQTAYVTATSEGPKTLLAGASGIYHDLVYLMGANESDAAVNIDITQTTGGTVQATLVIPANSTAGLSLGVPLPQDHADATWQVDNNSADDSNTTYSVTALFSKEV